MNKELIGRRLAQLRDELARPGEKKWTIAMVAEETGLTLNQVGTMERSGAGGTEILIAYLLFFYRRGYNLHWIIMPDNKNLSKVRLGEEIKTVDMQSVIDQMQHLKQVLDREVNTVVKTLEG